MGFLEAIDADGLLEQHAAQLGELEEKESKRVLRRYKEIRVELSDRLRGLPRDSYSAQKLRGILLQVESAVAAMNTSLLEGIGSSANTVIDQGIADLKKEIGHFDERFTGAAAPIDVDAVAIASDASQLLLNRYESSIDAYSEAIRSDVTRQLTDGIIMGKSVNDMLQGLGDYFFGEEWKLLRIARTELHNVYGTAKLRTMQSVSESTLPDLKKMLYHPLDSRTAPDSKALMKLDPRIPLNEPFRFKWGGKLRVFMTPPDRPNDRSILIPYRDAWGK